MLFFKFPKLCGYYRFEKQYFQHLKDLDIVIVRPSNWAEVVEEEASVGSLDGDKLRKELEHKLEKLMWKMNMFIACVVFGCVVMYVVMK